MVVTKWKVFRLGLVSILRLRCCIPVDAVSPKDRKRHVVPWGANNTAGSKSSHQLCCLPVAPEHNGKALLFSRQVLPHRCRIHFFPSQALFPKGLKYLGVPLEVAIWDDDYHEAGGTAYGLEPIAFVSLIPGGMRNTPQPSKLGSNQYLCPDKVLSVSIFIFPLINHIVLNTLFLSSVGHLNSGKLGKQCAVYNEAISSELCWW